MTFNSTKQQMTKEIKKTQETIYFYGSNRNRPQTELNYDEFVDNYIEDNQDNETEEQFKQRCKRVWTLLHTFTNDGEFDLGDSDKDDDPDEVLNDEMTKVIADLIKKERKLKIDIEDFNAGPITFFTTYVVSMTRNVTRQDFEDWVHWYEEHETEEEYEKRCDRLWKLVQEQMEGGYYYEFDEYDCDDDVEDALDQDTSKFIRDIVDNDEQTLNLRNGR